MLSALRIGFLYIGFLYITAPLWLPFLAIALFTELYHLPSERRFREQMKAASRYVGRTLPGGAGTIICDSPTFSWGIIRLWWTPDEVRSLAPVPEPSDDERNPSPYRWHEFDRWVSERYLDPQHGTALLVGVWHAGRLLPKLLKRYPGCTLVNSWSGGRDFEAHNRRMDRLARRYP